MNLFLDSSFFFPLISIDVKEFSKQLISELLENEGFEIFRSEMVTFELSAKGTQLVNKNLLEIEDVIQGLNALVYNSTIHVVPIYYSEIQILATLLRRDHSDFIDCLTLASAVHYSDTFITLDKHLEEKSMGIWNQSIKGINAEFKVYQWKDFSKQFQLEE